MRSQSRFFVETSSKEIPEEISLSKDAADHKNASDAIKHIFTSNLLRQTALDSLQGRGPSQIFTPVVSLPELEALDGLSTEIEDENTKEKIESLQDTLAAIIVTVNNAQEIV